MKKIELDIIALSHSVTQSNNYAVVLGEQEGMRRLPIVIGGFEAQAIAVAMERMTPTRPLTHDLFKNTLNTFKVNLKEIIINDLLDGVFYAKLICEQNGEVIEIDSRTSDALALAVRFNCPVFTYEFILENAGVILEGDEAKKEKVSHSQQSRKKGLESYSMDTLNKMLDEAIEKEDYEKAAKIRDEISRRSKES
ncbi:bifunctional nuclease family protein [Membranihabitans maritimus]|uniref:bifunctional nuclease family protein n=1 Tax=Membranihabitans maritimus TaxID=2904244 RepID=UPI001F3BF73D|nr:bifunctional nuclease family protein [Membranihabitans maritimus]